MTCPHCPKPDSLGCAVARGSPAIRCFCACHPDPMRPAPPTHVTINRTLTPEAWKRVCAADVWPITPQSFQKMLDVLAEVATEEKP